LRHAKASQISVVIALDEKLTILVTNNGVNSTANPPLAGRGSDILKSRCQSLGGSFHSQQLGTSWQAKISIPISCLN
ncbi:MAG: hypothetical protein GX029_12695, partial [Pseudomonadaceae bacterium]|nr:hypothetical protein [Pseudomonadaceae bacterium]